MINKTLISNIVLGGKPKDKDLTDVYIESADYDGEPMTDEQISALNDDHEFSQEAIFAKYY